MARGKLKKKTIEGAPLIHGAEDLPSVIVDDYNNELKDKDGFIGDKASKSAFQGKLDEARKAIRKGGDDPLGEKPTRELSKKDIDALMQGDDKEAAAVIMGAIDEFAGELATVLTKYLKQDAWKNTGRVAIGGGFKHSVVGEMAIARAGVLVKSAGHAIDLVPIQHHPDDAGLIGAAHLMPAWMLKGNQAILAVDIGGTNMRAGVIELKLDDHPDLSRAKVWKSTLWRHADDAPARSAAIERLVEMLETLIAKAVKSKLALAPVIGIACPGIINADGAIDRGGQNLPGGNWESEHFNLPQALAKAIPEISGQPTFVVMHNDAVIQGLSQIPFMQDVEGWGVLTIGTGLGNAHFTNKGEAGDAGKAEKGKDGKKAA
ncbi:ROK family protein [Rhizobium sp. TH2]|uniref:ROK family protein n=1 Tax=Rhizobium sp. TH2 TaxID=2775403 RepID=UPI00215898DC|nr:ROK family protein [Rhizobium sp. TH2]UVC10151.1 ROK family protein [Rhizobium sp. TH2]